MTLIRDLISLPERVFRGDFVLDLSRGVTDPKGTVASYVVTDQLVGCFDEALRFIEGAVASKVSKAAYLHGSFGSGKSHFMAILFLLLQGDVNARSIAKLAPVVARHNGWTEDKKFLLVPYHMIGAANMEAAILGGYARHVKELHPDAPLPGVYKSELLFQNARQLRERMGDQSFLAALNPGRPTPGSPASAPGSAPGSAGGGGPDGWGDLDKGWDAATFEAAMQAAPGSELRGRLVGDLVEHLLPAFRAAATNDGEAFIDLDTGLSIISRHAHTLGYDALILFLDELVLWLASRAQDMSFVQEEGQKLAKLVEAQNPDRPTPIVSFVARQRDLRELVGQNMPGADQLRFDDSLRWWEGRFHTIRLEDRNLPAIAAERVLKPKNEAARQEMDAAFKQTEKIRQEVMDILLTAKGDRQMFRQVYPFSPALVETLVAVSSMLQRERTAIKVMMQLLVEQRDTLKLGDIIPAGDLWDQIAHGDEAFSDVLRVQFENARKLYHEKFLPLLEEESGVGPEEVKHRPPEDPAATKFRNDDRLIKTLLLAALVPEVAAFKGMTVTRLAALNYGTIRSPIQGREAQDVLTRCRRWAGRVGQPRIGDEPGNPAVSIVLSGVDTESILEKVRAEDSPGNRRRKVLDLMCQQFGVERQDNMIVGREFLWRGTKRGAQLLFENAWDLPEDSFCNDRAEWKVILGYPFNAEGRNPTDAGARVEEFLEGNKGAQRTILWTPWLLSLEAQKDVGKLVLLDFVLTGERFGTLASHLQPADRAAARSLLENQQSQLRQKVIGCLEGAYGVATPPPGSVDTAHEHVERFHSLDKSFQPQPPVAANLSGALDHLVSQALDYQYPAHPRFEGEVRKRGVEVVLEEVRRAIQDNDGRTAVDQNKRATVKQIANPLKLGEMAETHFVIGRTWQTHFLKKAAEVGGVINVAKLREWMDMPVAMGLPRDLQNLLILTFAEQSNRTFVRFGGPFVEPTLDNLTPELELREQKLPSKDKWTAAKSRAEGIFGVAVSPLLNSTNLVQLRDEVRRIAEVTRADCVELSGQLRTILPHWEVEFETAARAQTAVATQQLIEAVLVPEDDPVEVLFRARVTTSEAAMGSSLKKAAAVAAALDGARWELFEAMRKLEDNRQAVGQAVLTDLREALTSDELARGLGGVLQELQLRAVKLLTAAAPPAPAPTSVPPAPPSPPAPHGWAKVAGDKADNLEGNKAMEYLEGLKKKLAEGSRLNVTWEIYRKEPRK